MAIQGARKAKTKRNSLDDLEGFITIFPLFLFLPRNIEVCSVMGRLCGWSNLFLWSCRIVHEPMDGSSPNWPQTWEQDSFWKSIPTIIDHYDHKHLMMIITKNHQSDEDLKWSWNEKWESPDPGGGDVEGKPSGRVEPSTNWNGIWICKYFLQ